MADNDLLEDPSDGAVLAMAEETFNTQVVTLRVLMKEFRKTAKSGELPKQTEYRDAIRELTKSANILQNERAKIAERRRKQRGANGSYALDLAEAREEIGRRLDSLAATIETE